MLLRPTPSNLRFSPGIRRSEGLRAGKVPDPERSEQPHQRDEQETFHCQGCPRAKGAPVEEVA